MKQNAISIKTIIDSFGFQEKERTVRFNREKRSFSSLFSSGLSGEDSLCFSVYCYTCCLETVLLIPYNLLSQKCRSRFCLPDQLLFIIKPMQLLLHVGLDFHTLFCISFFPKLNSLLPQISFFFFLIFINQKEFCEPEGILSLNKQLPHRNVWYTHTCMCSFWHMPSLHFFIFNPNDEHKGIF